MSPAEEIQTFRADFDAGFPRHTPHSVETMSDQQLSILAKSGTKGATEARAEIRNRMTARLRREIEQGRGGDAPA